MRVCEAYRCSLLERSWGERESSEYALAQMTSGRRISFALGNVHSVGGAALAGGRRC